MKAWNIWRRGKLIDTIFYDDDIPGEQVKDDLINHDGYDSDITVEEDTEKGKSYRAKLEELLETPEYRKIKYAVRSYLKNLSPENMEMAGSSLIIMIHSTTEGKE